MDRQYSISTSTVSTIILNDDDVNETTTSSGAADRVGTEDTPATTTLTTLLSKNGQRINDGNQSSHHNDSLLYGYPRTTRFTPHVNELLEDAAPRSVMEQCPGGYHIHVVGRDVAIRPNRKQSMMEIKRGVSNALNWWQTFLQTTLTQIDPPIPYDVSICISIGDWDDTKESPTNRRLASSGTNGCHFCGPNFKEIARLVRNTTYPIRP
jgi:hypothetical protein